MGVAIVAEIWEGRKKRLILKGITLEARVGIELPGAVEQAQVFDSATTQKP